MTARPAKPVSYGALLREAQGRFQAAGLKNSAHDAARLLQQAASFNRTQLMMEESSAVPPGIIERYEGFVVRRLAREPLYRIIGEREFHGLNFRLSPETLEPRDDTEALIELVLERLGQRVEGEPLRFVDLGTGTGIVALSLLSHFPKAEAVMVDLSAQACQTATENAQALGFSNRVDVCCGSWFEPLDGFAPFDFIVSNPPYIASNIVDDLSPEVLEHDPRLALDGGLSGLEAYKILLDQGRSFLKRDGFMALEMGYDQCESLKALAHKHHWRFEGLKQDLSGNDRAMVFQPI